ncbi:uncharacterized protein BDW47DRAFT_99112 [Aspergillus candidus]|uniref:Uncharacterized protein n=1 Tax=Aspergillus candidus TaxID=41067 RepID=A0A2I2FLH4_ASPCN|nr:hypothetical protein BDW47DRAFT_99112 [Aspergillus candidus]PLB41463.1 hypothetical protein BDW47DRAFT_99112 [Aspergillus candidus]
MRLTGPRYRAAGGSNENDSNAILQAVWPPPERIRFVLVGLEVSCLVAITIVRLVLISPFLPT